MTLSNPLISFKIVSCEDVVQAIHLLKNGKSDGLDLFSEHLKYACSAISDDLSIFFTARLSIGKTWNACVFVIESPRGRSAKRPRRV